MIVVSDMTDTTVPEAWKPIPYLCLIREVLLLCNVHQPLRGHGDDATARAGYAMTTTTTTFTIGID